MGSISIESKQIGTYPTYDINHLIICLDKNIFYYKIFVDVQPTNHKIIVD